MRVLRSLRSLRILYQASNTRRMMSSSPPSGGAIAASSFHPTLLEGPDALMLSNSNSKFIDGTWYMDKTKNPAQDYLDEHIDGSYFFNIDEVCDKSSSLPHMMPSSELFAKTMDSMRIKNDDHVVVYTQPNCMSGPRVWWMFRAFGHRNVSLLNGGINAWKSAGGSVSSLPEMPPLAVSPEDNSEGSYKAALNTGAVAKLGDMKRIVDTGLAQICDARSSGRFYGTAPEPRPGLVGGHIPGSLNLPFNSLLEENDVTRFKAPEEIRDILQDAGVIFGSKIVTTCGSGVTAAILTLGLALMGKDLDDAPIYDGSWSEYGNPDLDLPRMPDT